LRCFRAFVALEVISGADGLAGVHTDRPLGRGYLCIFLSGRDARRKRRQDLGRRDRSRGAQLCCSALRVAT